MTVYSSILDIKSEIPYCREMKRLLALLERVNPCNQLYWVNDDSFLISYSIKLNLFNFKNIFPLKANVTIIGMPVSICSRGYWGNIDSVVRTIKQIKGLKVVLNAGHEFSNYGKTLSTFIFDNRFHSFEEYIGELRSPYRRRIMKAILRGKGIECRSLDNKDFSLNHYELYLSIMKRTKNPLEILPIEFFTDYEADLFEFVDRENDKLLGFIQLKEFDGELCFMFGGFKREDNEAYDLYYNMLLNIIQIGIERGCKTINFGQTAEESKLKIGCKEVPKYLYVHHSNPLLNVILQLLVPVFSYKPYNVEHHVFKQNQDNAGGIST